MEGRMSKVPNEISLLLHIQYHILCLFSNVMRGIVG